MKTFLITGSDTGIGKTWTIGLLARRFSRRGSSVQVVKAIESGVSAQDESDEARATSGCDTNLVSGFTIRSFATPIAPLAAARVEGKKLEIDAIISEMHALPHVDYRFVEGAGSVAVPLGDSGFDWIDFARESKLSKVLVVVEDRLGAIGQARLAWSYACRGASDVSVWLNEIHKQSDVQRQSTWDGLRALGIPIAGCSRFESDAADILEEGWFE